MKNNSMIMVGAVLLVAAAQSGLVAKADAGNMPEILGTVVVTPGHVLDDKDMATITGSLAAAAAAVGTGAGTDTAYASIMTNSSVNGGIANASSSAVGAATGTVAASASGSASATGTDSAAAGVSAGSSIDGGTPSTYVSGFTYGR